jgi:hypothetical protein
MKQRPQLQSSQGQHEFEHLTASLAASESPEHWQKEVLLEGEGEVGRPAPGAWHELQVVHADDDTCGLVADGVREAADGEHPEVAESNAEGTTKQEKDRQVDVPVWEDVGQPEKPRRNQPAAEECRAAGLLLAWVKRLDLEEAFDHERESAEFEQKAG